MDTIELGKALDEFAKDILANSDLPAWCGVSVKTQSPAFPQTRGEPPKPVSDPKWTGHFEIVTTPHADVRAEDVKDVRAAAAALIRKAIENDPTLGQRVTMSEGVAIGFDDEVGVLHASGLIDAPQ